MGENRGHGGSFLPSSHPWCGLSPCDARGTWTRAHRVPRPRRRALVRGRWA
ncbi:hypothetical protein HMPREF1868_01420 [Olsenella sp. DNF00959]|nr:hypothetical protein HMPREF1868_01420 [Olsenella sp. DNF00959]